MSRNIPAEQVQCPYCGALAAFHESSEIVYGRDYGSIYHCGCVGKRGAWVGCHKGTTKPLGTLADSRLRRARKIAHEVVDSLWRFGPIHRSSTYRWLSEALQIDVQDCHIGMFDLETCNRAIDVGLTEIRRRGLV